MTTKINIINLIRNTRMKKHLSEMIDHIRNGKHNEAGKPLSEYITKKSKKILNEMIPSNKLTTLIGMLRNNASMLNDLLKHIGKYDSVQSPRIMSEIVERLKSNLDDNSISDFELRNLIGAIDNGEIFKSEFDKILNVDNDQEVNVQHIDSVSKEEASMSNIAKYNRWKKESDFVVPFKIYNSMSADELERTFSYTKYREWGGESGNYSVSYSTWIRREIDKHMRNMT